MGRLSRYSATLCAPATMLRWLQHDALRLAGAARGVEDRRHVGVDDAMRTPEVADAGERAVGLREESAAPELAGESEPSRTTSLRSGHCARTSASVGEPLLGGDQHLDVAVPQYVADLLGLQQRIDRHHHAAGAAGRRTSPRPGRSTCRRSGRPGPGPRGRMPSVHWRSAARSRSNSP